MVAPYWRRVERCSYFVLCAPGVNPSAKEQWLVEPRIYPMPIERNFDLDALAELSEEEADSGEEDGLQGNQQYRDLRGATWAQVKHAVDAETTLFERFAAAVDLDAEAENYDQERDEALFPEDDLWGLDVGVIAAALALSALGAVTASSCNAGGFGGRHVAIFPHVAFFASRATAVEILAIAEAADVGLDVVEGGIGRLYGHTDFDLHRFARAALARQATSGG